MELSSAVDKVVSIGRSLYNRILADEEGGAGPTGYLSYRAEWHSALWGLGTGFIAGVTGQWWILVAGIGWMFTRAADRNVPGYIPYPKQFVKESGYVVGHAVGGSVLGVVVNVISYAYILTILF